MARKTSIAFDPDILSRHNNAIAQGALTNSKRPECFIKGVFPTHISKGKGVHIWDTKGNKYVDFTAALGTNIVGFANDEVNEAIFRTLGSGASLPLASELEIETAEKVKEMFPFVEKLKFLKTGSEACCAAIRIARAKTGRKNIVSHGYHGWLDEFVFLQPPAIGVMPHPHIHMFGQEYLPTCDDAAVIIEPIMTDMSDSRVSYLKCLRKTCTETGTLLIFDEIITGFRTPCFSMAAHLNIIPDIICLGKAIANGMPLSVVGGRQEIMECDEYFVSSTFAGERASLASALKTMQLLQTKKYDLEYLWNKGAEFQFKFNSLWPDGIRLQGYPTRAVLEGHKDILDLFRQEALRAGYFFGPSFFFTFGHIELIDQIISGCRDIIQRLKTGSIKLDGEPSKSAFAQKTRST